MKIYCPHLKTNIEISSFIYFLEYYPFRCVCGRDLHQTVLTGGEKEKMKLKDLPREKPRIELKDLPPTNVLKAISEEWREAVEGKTGGLVINFQQKDGKTFSQKYGKLHGDVLSAALDKLGLKDTQELQNAWYVYEMRSFRAGFPRYMPVKKA
jgi:hypothetical protein